ncbi:muscle M-line assembly protein unc-89-like [Patiria miniata]|uniref:Nucleolus and neural progenitor protein-like N-terminal domain-containing protein n=1 Tax=Patiria miniata TaxID=46514 RepID=A0A914BA76_PATMI|nr:muscle M-line assembly protein unc-89-like [Patiria miniata]
MKDKMAASMWNDTRVSPPPIASCSYDCYEIEEVDVYNLKLALQVIQTSHTTGLGLSSEQYTLSRLLYKANNQQRHWRWYQMLKKIQKGLRRLQANNPVKFMEDAIGCCQINRNQTGCGSITIHLPACQMLEYILVKLMVQAKLCAYILNMAEKVYVFVVQNITSGQFLAHNTIYASIVSRIWVMMRAMLRDILPWYSTLRPWADRLKATSMQWMSAGEVLPQSLYDWLRPDYDPYKYANAIDQTSKKTSSSLLDNMFPAANLATPEAAISASSIDRDLHGKDVAMAPSLAPSMDLGEPITARELSENRKRKQTDSDYLQEPATKKSRCEIESWTPEDPTMRIASGTTIVQPETCMKESRFSHEIEHSEDVDLGQMKNKKQSKGILRHLKQRLKGEEKRTELASDSESRTNKVAGSSNREPEGRRTTWRKNLKKSLKKTFEKLTKNPSANNDKTNPDLELSMDELNPVGEEQRSAASVGWSEVGHGRKKLKGTRKVTKEALATDSKDSACKGQVEGMHKDQMDKAEGFQSRLKLPKKSKERQEIEDRQHEAKDPIVSSVAHDMENPFTLTFCPPETSQSKTSKKLKKKAKDKKKSKKLSSSSEDRHPQICEEMSNRISNITEEFVKHNKRKQHNDERESKNRNSQEKPVEKFLPTSPSQAPHQDQIKTKKKAVKRKREVTESGVSLKGIFKKSKKHQSESSLVCDLGQITRREPVKSNNQESDIDNIFALLE